MDIDFSMSGPQQDRDATQGKGGYELHYDITPNLEFRNRARVTTSDVEFVNVQSTGVEGTTLNRVTNKNDNEGTDYFVPAEFNYRVETWGIGHNVLVGGEYGREDFDVVNRRPDAHPARRHWNHSVVEALAAEWSQFRPPLRSK